jgi:type IV secretory pathway TrbF-like protein
VSQETAVDWQKRLDRTGTVVIRSNRHTAVWIMLGCVGLMVLGISLAIGGSWLERTVGVVPLVGGLIGLARIGNTVITGQPHLVVTAERLDYGRHSVSWSSVREVVRHTVTVRGTISTYVWILHGNRDRLRLPDTLHADMDELGTWLRGVYSRYCDLSSSE